MLQQNYLSVHFHHNVHDVVLYGIPCGMARYFFGTTFITPFMIDQWPGNVQTNG